MTEREYAEKRMQQKWYELVQAEQQGSSLQQLERLYNAYMLSVEEYNHRLQAEQPLLATISPAQEQTSKRSKPKRKAS